LLKLIGGQRSYRNGEINVSDGEIRDRIRFQGLTEEDLGVIATWDRAFQGAADQLIDLFYEHIFGNSDTRAIVEKHTTVERQRPLVTRYVQSMFSGRVDDQFVEYRRRVGVAHDNIDLDANYYVAMYEVIRQVMVKAVRKAGANASELQRFEEALSRLLDVDKGLVLRSLMDSRRAKIEALRDQEAKKAAEASAFISDLSETLDHLAARDLAARLTAEYSGDYGRIRDALNTAAQTLDDGLSEVAVGAEQVASASDQISSGSQGLAQGASEQASSLEEISSSLQEMASMSRQNAANAREARALTEAARAAATKGGDSMQRLSEAVSKIKVSADETAKIVKTIDAIAFQTNLLALNAAVEAARRRRRQGLCGCSRRGAQLSDEERGSSQEHDESD